MQYKYLSLLVILLVLPLISALQVTNGTSFNITKFYGETKTFSLDLLNNQAFTMYNITATPNDINFPVISELVSGASAHVNMSISSNDNIASKVYTVKGYYTSQIGSSAEHHQVNIDFYNGIDKCSFTIIKGDTVDFHNLVNDNIILKNQDTMIDITNMAIGANYSTTFSEPGTLTYIVTRRGYIFNDPCTITILNDNGLVNNPAYNTQFTLSLNVIYLPTNISYVILQNNYSIPIFTSQDGLISLTNNGVNTAKNVVLSSEWFSFSANNFDIAPSTTKVISYTISPIITNSNQTNQTYIKSVAINGNFNTITQPFNIFIPYSNVVTQPSSQYDSLISVIQAYCVLHPTESFCQTEPKTVYVYGNQSGSINVTFTQDQVKGIFDYVFKIGDDLNVKSNYDKEQFASISETVGNMSSVYNELKAEYAKLTTEKESSNSFFIFMVSLIAGIVILILLGLLGLLYYRHNKKRKVERF